MLYIIKESIYELRDKTGPKEGFLMRIRVIVCMRAHLHIWCYRQGFLDKNLVLTSIRHFYLE
jgi:hypothetical protein